MTPHERLARSVRKYLRALDETGEATSEDLRAALAALAAVEAEGRVEWKPYKHNDGTEIARLPDGRELVVTPAGIRNHSPWAWSIYASSDPHSWIDEPGMYGECAAIEDAKRAAEAAAGVGSGK